MDVVTEMMATVAQWPGITAHPHRFGGTEFKLSNVEIGHIHRGGLVDIPFPRKIKAQLLSEGKASTHHILPDSGWISFWMRADEDLERAVWLMRLSYLHKLAARSRPSWVNEFSINIRAELVRFEMSAPLRLLVERASRVQG